MGFELLHLSRQHCFWLREDLPLPQVFEHRLITGLHTYTRGWLERGNKSDFRLGCSWSRKTTIVEMFHILKEHWSSSYRWFYLSVWFPPNGTHVYHTGHRIGGFNLLWTKTLIDFNIHATFRLDARYNLFCFSWPADCRTIPWLWCVPSINAQTKDLQC